VCWWERKIVRAVVPCCLLWFHSLICIEDLLVLSFLHVLQFKFPSCCALFSIGRPFWRRPGLHAAGGACRAWGKLCSVCLTQRSKLCMD
jgi:hypothetical protein